MGTRVESLPHSCGSSDALQVFVHEDDRVDGYCFSCDTFVENPYGKKVDGKSLPKRKEKTKEEVQEQLEEISGYRTVSLPTRKLGERHLSYFGIKVALSEEDGSTPTARYYPYTNKGVITGYKVKLVAKKIMWSVGSISNGDLFGWEQAIKSGSKTLVITEGEDDAVAVRYVLDKFTKDEYRDFMPTVVSLISGTSSAKRDIGRLYQKIVSNFENIILCFDMDEQGDKAATEVLKLFTNAKTVKMPCNDANECIMEGYERKLFNAIRWDASKKKNSRLVFASDLHEAAREQAKMGQLAWPWAHINDVTRGIRYGETIYIGAGVKMGKSEILNALAAYFINQYQVKVFMAKPEEGNKKTYKLMAGKVVGKVFHDPNVEMDYDAYDEAGKILDDKLCMINLYQHIGWESLKQDIIAATQWGAKVVFIDPITNLTNGINAGEANEKLQEIAQDLAALAKDLDIVVFIFCHLKAHDSNISKEVRLKKYKEGIYTEIGNCPHEYGGDIYSSQFAGSRAMMRSCNYMIGLEGNKDPDLDEYSDTIRNTRVLKLLEDREFGESGRFSLYWNKNTTLFGEI